jgi:parallel beta-helix repeat protein
MNVVFAVLALFSLMLGTMSAPAAADNAGTHDTVTDNAAGRQHQRAVSENRTLHSPVFSRYSAPARGYTAGSTWYVNGALGTDDGTHGSGSGASAFKTIQYALDEARVLNGDTINIAAAYASGNFYNEQLSISKSISLVGEAEEGWIGGTRVEQSGLLVVDITSPGLDVHISNLTIRSLNWVGQCIRASGDTLTLDNVYFFGDRRSGGGGGGIYADNCTLTLNGCYMGGSAGSGDGGAIYANNCTLTLNGCISEGQADKGGGIYAVDSTVSATDCFFSECEANAGGAIYLTSSNLTALRCSFDANQGDGAGLYVNAVDGDCAVAMSNCTFFDNYNDPWPGAGYGGAIYEESNTGHATLSLASCTLYSNYVGGSDTNYGGGLYVNGANCSATIRNCIFDNDAEEGDNIYVASGAVDSDYNLYSDTPAGFTRGSHDIINANPKNYEMSDNGGLTPTCAIDSTSPARGAGSTALATDQRGVTRGSPSDIGAYQWVGPTYANNATGNDANSGLSAGQAKKHVYAAVNLAGPGSTTYVAAGTYLGEFHWDVYDLEFYNINIYKPLTLTGAGASTTIIDDSASHDDYDDDTILDVYGGSYYDPDTDEDVHGPVSINGFTLKNAQGGDCYGGGLYIESKGVTTVSDCIMEDNFAGNGGGGVYIEYAGEVALTGCTIRNNSADDYGGGIYAYGADNVSISGCTVTGNTSTDPGGGIYFDSCSLFSLAGSTISLNTSEGDGGGIYGNYFYGCYYDGDEEQYYGTTLSGCTIDGNTSDASGGGVFLYEIDDDTYTAIIEGCTLSNNRSDDGGAGLNNRYNSRVELTNCTVYGNSVTDADGEEGGGVYNEGHAEVYNCTIASNNAHAGGEGGGWYEQGRFTGIFKNTILANNLAGTNPDDIAGDGSFDSQGHNICTTDASRDYFNQPTDNVSTNPGLGILANNGGPTFTCAIGSTSPAFNTAADGPATDQRGTGYPRPALGGYDVGAFELQTLVPGPTVTSCNPASGTRGQAVTVTITGTNFTGATAVVFTDNITDLTGPFTVISPTQISITLSIPAGATLGAYDVLVTTPDGMGVGHGKFTVVQAALLPTIITVNPAEGTRNQSLTVTITGTNLTGATAVSFGAGVTVSSFTVNSPTQITVNITVAPDAALGARTVSVTTPAGTAAKADGFTVIQGHLIGTGSASGSGTYGSGGFSNPSLTPPSPLPNIGNTSATLSASEILPGETVEVSTTVTNTGNAGGSSVVRVYVNGQAVDTRAVTLDPGQSQVVRFNIPAAEAGQYDVTVNNVRAGTFTVQDTRANDVIFWASFLMIIAALVMGVIYAWRRREGYYS